MQIHRSNRLLPIIGIVMILVFVLVMQRACSDRPDSAVLLEEVPNASSTDADTPADTITTLTANVAAMTRELKRLEKDNAELRNDNRDLKNQREALESEMTARIADQISRLKDQSAIENAATIDALNRRVDSLADSVAQVPVPAMGSDLPIGFGYDTPTNTEDWNWIEPLDAGAPPGGELPTMGIRRTGAADPQPVPHFTVPRNATLLGARAMTAMLGRVPIRGEVRDPMPFKVLTGTDNLAANGYQVPGVAGMVWTGTAIGDWTLSCVRGELHSVTFIFADGSIRTISSDEAQNQTGNGRRALGWISDTRGVPCVSGARKSNAGHYLSQRIGAKTVQAAADAAAAAQTSTVIRDSGGISSSVDGELGPYILGRSVADGSAEVAQWLADRQAQSFDAVFVPAGADLVIHVDRELAIDLDPNTRKLHHAASRDADSALSLD